MGLISAIKNARKKRDARKDTNLSLGGSKAKERELLESANLRSYNAEARSRTAQDNLKGEYKEAKSMADSYAGDYAGARRTNERALGAQRTSIGGIGAGAGQASGILGAAQGTNQLTGSTDSILAQRAAQMGAAPSHNQLADQAILANQQNARAQTNFSQGQLAKQAMGMAAGQGEGGALAAQQAMASLVGAGGNMAAQANLQQMQSAADMRAQANLAQRGETVAEAGYASDARLGATAQERANQLAVAGKQAELAYNSGLATNAAQSAYTGATQAGLNTAGAQQQAAANRQTGVATAMGTQNVAREGVHIGAENELLTAGMNAGAARESAQERPGWAKALFPMGMLGPQS